MASGQGVFPHANVARYFVLLDRSREAALLQSLFIVREALDKFHMDRRRSPESLDELVSERCLRQLYQNSASGRRDWGGSVDGLGIVAVCLAAAWKAEARCAQASP